MPNPPSETPDTPAPGFSRTIKLSSPATREFWEISVLYEDNHFLALDKPARLLTSPDRFDPARPNLMALLHEGIARGAPWARERALSYLMNTHRLDPETSGVLLLAKTKPALIAAANLFGSGRISSACLALIQGSPGGPTFEVGAKLAPHQTLPGAMRVNSKHGKHAETRFELVEGFDGYSLVRCLPQTHRAHQIRVHLNFAGLPIAGDTVYGGAPMLLSRLKSAYRLKPGRVERPLIDRVALHSESLKFAHPVTGAELAIAAPLPKDFEVAIKYLRRYAPAPPR